MTEDIVSQLRRVPDSILRFSGPEPNPYYHRCQAAADEIERLRAEVNALKFMISPVPNPEYRYFVHPDAASTFAQLLRGEF